jgi:hypothetical protein
MNALLSLTIFAAFYPTPPAGPATAPNPDYPVHIHIIIAKSSGGNGDYHGFGRGDILGATLQGFDYTFSCGQPFLNNSIDAEFYQAKWKKPNEKLEILIQPIGSNHINHCDLNVSLKDKPYFWRPGQNAGQTTVPAP